MLFNLLGSDISTVWDLLNRPITQAPSGDEGHSWHSRERKPTGLYKGNHSIGLCLTEPRPTVTRKQGRQEHLVHMQFFHFGNLIYARYDEVPSLARF